MKVRGDGIITCPYCGGPTKCKKCGITCADAGGLTEEGLCAGCSVNYPEGIKGCEINNE